MISLKSGPCAGRVFVGVEVVAGNSSRMIVDEIRQGGMEIQTGMAACG